VLDELAQVIHDHLGQKLIIFQDGHATDTDPDTMDTAIEEDLTVHKGCGCIIPDMLFYMLSVGYADPREDLRNIQDNIDNFRTLQPEMLVATGYFEQFAVYGTTRRAEVEAAMRTIYGIVGELGADVDGLVRNIPDFLDEATGEVDARWEMEGLTAFSEAISTYVDIPEGLEGPTLFRTGRNMFGLNYGNLAHNAVEILLPNRFLLSLFVQRGFSYLPPAEHYRSWNHFNVLDQYIAEMAVPTGDGWAVAAGNNTVTIDLRNIRHDPTLCPMCTNNKAELYIPDTTDAIVEEITDSFLNELCMKGDNT